MEVINMTTEEINHTSILDLSMHDFNVMYCDNVGKSEVENICETCKYSDDICDLCVVHADNVAYIEDGKGIIIHCNMYERIDNV